MEEIIAKSRMYRALKAKQREEDEAALAAINEEFKQLVRSAALSTLIKARGENK
jgi:nucleolar protein 14